MSESLAAADHRHELTEAETLFLLKMALRKVSAGVFRDMRGRADKVEFAYDIAAQTMLEHFKLAKHRVTRGPGAPRH